MKVITRGIGNEFYGRYVMYGDIYCTEMYRYIHTTVCGTEMYGDISERIR